MITFSGIDINPLRIDVMYVFSQGNQFLVRIEVSGRSVAIDGRKHDTLEAAEQERNSIRLAIKNFYEGQA